MSLRLIDSKYVLYIFIKAGINIFQPLRDVFMYRRFAHAKLFCGAAYGGLVFHDILPSLVARSSMTLLDIWAPLASNVIIHMKRKMPFSTYLAGFFGIGKILNSHF